VPVAGYFEPGFAALLAAADEAPNGAIRALAARYDAPPGWTVQARMPFSSARK